MGPLASAARCSDCTIAAFSRRVKLIDQAEYGGDPFRDCLMPGQDG
jgi:hypothetical protein